MLTTHPQPAQANPKQAIPELNEEDLAEYIGHLAHGLSKLAKRPKFETISYLLELVVIEANGMTPSMKRSRPNKERQPCEV